MFEILIKATILATTYFKGPRKKNLYRYTKGILTDPFKRNS